VSERIRPVQVAQLPTQRIRETGWEYVKRSAATGAPCPPFSLASRTESLDANLLLLNPCAGQGIGGGIGKP